MKYLFSILSIGILLSCGDSKGDATSQTPEKAENDKINESNEQPYCKDIEGLNYREFAFKGIPKDYEGVIYSCHDFKVVELSNYKDGKLDGLYRQWYNNGQLRYEVNFKTGKIISEKSWDKKGRVSIKEPYSIMSYSHIGPHDLIVFDDYEKGLEYAKLNQKKVFLDFNGVASVNSRIMEEDVWGAPFIIDMLRNELVIISLSVDDRTELPINEQKMIADHKGRMVQLRTYGQKWLNFQVSKYKTNYQPYYRMLNQYGEDLSNGFADYNNHKIPKKFQEWLNKGLNSNGLN